MTEKLKLNENHLESDEIRNKNVVVPFFELECFHRDSINFYDKFKGFNLLICEDMLAQEMSIFRSLKKYLTKNRKGILLIREDLQVLCANEKDAIGFSSFEQIGAVILNR